MKSIIRIAMILVASSMLIACGAETEDDTTAAGTGSGTETGTETPSEETTEEGAARRPPPQGMLLL